MSATSTDYRTAAAENRARLLEFARKLDHQSRETEEFLISRLAQLQAAVEEFEAEKAAWRRQYQRESRRLEEQLAELKSGKTDSVTTAVSSPAVSGTVDAAAIRKSGADGFRMLIQTCNATPLQVGVLLFELSKLNRDVGGQGVQFAVTDVRIPKKRLLSRNVGPHDTALMLELSGTSVLPLGARGTHVSLDVDVTDRIESWIQFKIVLLQSALRDEALARAFRKGRIAGGTDETKAFIREATRRADTSDQRAFGSLPGGYSPAPHAGGGPRGVRQQQLERLESCCDRLRDDTSMRVHISL